MRLLSRSACSTSQLQIGERAEVGVSTKTTVSASLIQVAEAALPFLATGDAVTIDAGFKAISIECGLELVGEVRVIAAVGDENGSLPLSGESGRLACCGAMSPRFGEAGPDASCATSAIARLLSLH